MSELGKQLNVASQPWDCAHCGSPECRIAVYEHGIRWECGHQETFPIGTTEVLDG